MTIKAVVTVCPKCNHTQDDIVHHSEGLDPCQKCGGEMHIDEGIHPQSAGVFDPVKMNIKGWSSWG